MMASNITFRNLSSSATNFAPSLMLPLVLSNTRITNRLLPPNAVQHNSTIDLTNRTFLLPPMPPAMPPFGGHFPPQSVSFLGLIWNHILWSFTHWTTMPPPHPHPHPHQPPPPPPPTSPGVAMPRPPSIFPSIFAPMFPPILPLRPIRPPFFRPPIMHPIMPPIMPPSFFTPPPFSPEPSTDMTPSEPEPPTTPASMLADRFSFRKCGYTITQLSRMRGDEPVDDASTISAHQNQIRIVGGQETAIDLAPWQVSLQRPRKISHQPNHNPQQQRPPHFEQTMIQMRHYCGGSVIHPHWILTAAHCLDWCTDKNGRPTRAIAGLRVIAGIDSVSSPLSYVKYAQSNRCRYPPPRVAAVFVYPGYVKSKSNNDIALLRLDRPLPLFPCAKINTICLPTPNEPLPSGKAMTASGWGHIAEKGKPSYYLRTVNVSVVNESLCVQAYGNESYNVHQMICAGEKGKDSCQGDSGGPLFRVDPEIGRNTQFGITSFGYGCGREGYPGIYTEVSNYIGWIIGMVQGNIGTPYSGSGGKWHQNAHQSDPKRKRIAIDRVGE